MTGISSVNSIYAQDALKYINGQPVANDSIIDDVSGAFGSVPLVAGINGTIFTGGQVLKKTTTQATSIFTGQPAKTLFGNAKYKRAGIRGLVDTTAIMYDVLKDANLTKILNNSKGLSNASKNLEAANLVKDFAKSGKSKAEITKLLKGCNNADDIIKTFGKKTTDVVQKTSKFAKAGKWLSGTGVGKTFLGSSFYKSTASAGSKFLTTTSAGKLISKGAGKFAKAYKTCGAGFNLAIEGGLALFTDVIPAFSQGGFGEGMKQVGKSAAKVGASTAGWVAGATGGKALGAWLGGAIGSAIPVVGTAIGAVVGGFIGDLVGGAIGSAVAGKVTEKIVGEDYTDKVMNEQIEAQAAMISQDSALMSELNSTVYAMIEQDMADDGKLSKDSEKILEYLQQNADDYNGLNFGALKGAGTNTTAQNTSSNLDTLIARIQAGDTSVYDVPQDALEASSKSYNNTSFTGGYANNYTNFGYTNPYANSFGGGTNQVMNYFAEA